MPNGDGSQAPVVHVHDSGPEDRVLVDVQYVSLVEVVVQHCGEEVVRHGDCMQVPCEMQVNLLHRQNLGQPASCRAPLYPEDRAHGRLPDDATCLLPDPVQALIQTNGCHGLALPEWGRIDAGYENQPTVSPGFGLFYPVPGNFGYVGAVESEVLPLDADCLSNLLNREQFRTSGYLKIGIHRATHGKPHLKPSSGNMRWDVQ